MYTTLNKIRANHPCAHGWETLLRFLGKTGPDDEPLSVLTILKSNGLKDALWCLRAVEGFDREKRLFAVKCARRVQHLLKDQRLLNVLYVAESYANGMATSEESEEAVEAAWAAVRAAAGAAAWAAAWAAARTAARAAAGAAAWGATWAADAASWADSEAGRKALAAELSFQEAAFIEMVSSTQEES